MTSMSLAGDWNYLFDPNDLGIEEKWFQQTFDHQPFTLPGTQATNRVGKKLDETLADDLNKTSVQSFRESFSYRGVMWLQKEVVLPDDFRNRQLTLFLERTLGSTHIWIDNTFIGEDYSLSIPHQYALQADQLTGKKKITITIRLDNRNSYHLGELTSGYSEHTQGFWSGIVGEIALYKDKLLNENMTVNYDNRLKTITVTCPKGSEHIPVIRVTDQNDQELESEVTLIQETSEAYTFAIISRKKLIWNEFTPEFYQVHAEYDQGDFKKRVASVDPIRSRDSITLNGKKVFLRGTLDCAVFPETGHPPMGEDEWERIFLKLKAYGINHVRYHCWCPPEAAFAAADRLGLYLMVEGPFWLDEWFDNSVGDHPEHYELIRQECLSIVKMYGHHPSFLLFSVGNELHGDFDFLSDVLKHESFSRKQILTTVTANTTNYQRDFYEGADDFFVGVQYEEKGLRGNRFLDRMVKETALNYEEGADNVPVPVITHEIGQYASYPSLYEIEKLNGTMVPINLRAIKNDLMRKNMEQEHEDFTYYSGKFALDLYKAEIEAAVRTRSLSGFQLLGLQDYPGQNTAMIGMLDSHWEEKGFCTSEEFKSFCDAVIPIVEMKKRIFEADETMTYKLGVRNSLFKDVQELKARVTVITADTVLYEQEFKGDAKQGTYSIIAESEVDLSMLNPGSAKGETIEVFAEVEVDGKLYRNRWDIWVFPTEASVEKNTEDDSVVSDSWLSPKVIEGLRRGEKCLISIDPRRSLFADPGNYFPVFWSPVFFESAVSCGSLIDKSHPIFDRFPTFSHTTLQWKNLMEHAVTFPLHQYEGIVQTIPNFYNNERRSYLAEFKVGSGKLILTGFDLEGGKSLEEKEFKQSILDYMNAETFQPANQISLEALTEAYRFDAAVETEKPVDLAFGKKAWADNEQSEKTSAAKVIDGNHLTHWTTAAQTEGHWWCVDLGTVEEVTKLVIEPLNPEHMAFEVSGSKDNEHWDNIAQSSQPQDKHELDVSGEYQFIRIDMLHPINIAAGLRNVQIF